MSLKRKILLVSGSVISLFTIVVIILYFWIVGHASSLLTRLVDKETNGKLALTVKSVKFNLLDRRVRIFQADLRTKDSSNSPSGYHIKAKKITLKVESIFSFILNKQLTVDSIIVNSPEINVFKYKQGTQKKVSLPQEFEHAYQSLEKVLQQVKLNYLHFDSTSFYIYDRTRPGSKPLSVSHLNLTINTMATRGKVAAEKRFMFADRILLEIFNEDIQFKEGLQGIKFKRLRLSTGSRTVKLDSCNLYAKSSLTSYDNLNVFLDSINIWNLDFNRLAKNDLLKLDSAICFNPEIKFQIESKEKKKKKSVVIKKGPTNKDSMVMEFKKLLGNIDIGYLAVNNASIRLSSKKQDIISNYSADKIDFGIKNLVIIDDPAVPIQLSEVNLAIRNYEAYKLDSLYNVKFDSIKLVNDKIRLANFSLITTKDFKQISNSTIKAHAFELTNIDWPILIYEHRLIADNASLIQPEVILNLPYNKSKIHKPTKAETVSPLHSLKQQIELKNFYIVDGNVNIKIANGTTINVENCFADINVSRLMNESSIKSSFEAMDRLSFSKASFINKNLSFNAKGGSYSNTENALKFLEVNQSKMDKSLSAAFKNLQVKGISINEGNSYAVSNLSWGFADIKINMKQNQANKANKSKEPFNVSVNKVSGGPSRLSFNTSNIAISTNITTLSTDEILFAAGEKPIIKGLHIDGQPFLINRNKNESGVASFFISDIEKSTLRNITLRFPSKEHSIKIVIPELAFSTDINKGINGIITSEYIELNKPVISFEPLSVIIENKPKVSKGKLPILKIGELKIHEPSFVNLPESIEKKMHLTVSNADFLIKNINSDGHELKVGSVKASIERPGFNNGKIKLIPTGKELVKLDVSDFNIKPWVDSNTQKWAFTLNSFSSEYFLINTIKSDTVKQIIALNSLSLERLLLNSRSIKNYKELLINSQQFLLSKGNVILNNGKTIMEVNNLQLDRDNHQLSLDSFSFYPVLDRDSFMRARKYQTGYTQLKTGKLLVNDLDFVNLTNDTVFVAKKATINSAWLSIFRDKRLPFEYGIEKPMLTDLIRNIKLKLNVDSVLIRSSAIEYEEINDKTLMTGKVKFANIRGNVTGVKNYNYLPEDSLRFKVSTLFMDAAKAKVRYAQSYTDSLSSFHIRVNISPFNLTALNPMLEPLASARLKSGFLDTIAMSAIGRKYVALGKMQMYYHDLNFVYLDKGSEVKKTFKTRLISFLGNLIVHKKHVRGSGDIYAERLTEKGFPNYWVKILLSGVLTNTGIRSNKKQMKKYKKGLQKFDVPPITEVEID